MSNPTNFDNSSFLYNAFEKAMAHVPKQDKIPSSTDSDDEWDDAPVNLPTAPIEEGRILPFYYGQEGDWKTRKIEEIWDFSLNDLEDTHDYIQWLFPLNEASGSHAGAPILTEHEITRFKSDGDLQQRLQKSFRTMLAFYGLGYADGKVKELENFDKRRTVWLSRENHNLLRLTRIMKSLNILGLEKESHALYDFLSNLHSRSVVKIISNETLNYWKLAAYPPGKKLT